MNNKSETKSPEPERFDGTCPPVRHFIGQLRLQFALNPTRYSSEEEKVLYTFSLMKGPAFEWACTLLESQDAILKSHEGVLNAMITLFDAPDRVQTAMHNLANLKQGSNSVSDYATKFKQLAAMVKWEETGLMHHFRQGLASHIKDELAARDWPSTLVEMMTLAIRIDHRLTERAQERVLEQLALKAQQPLRDFSLGSNSNPNAMEIDATSRMNNLTCHYCRKPGHFIAVCRKRLFREQQLKAKGQAPQ